MNWLLWKDFRHNLPVVIVAALLGLGPYAIALAAICWARMHHETEPGWRHAIAEAGVFSLILSQLIVAVFAGNAIAGERADRSAEFQASLPIPRTKILASKLLLILAAVAAIWLVNSPALWLAYTFFPRDGLPQVVSVIALTGLLFFGVAWMLSALLTSPTFSIFGGLAAPLVFLSAVYLLGVLLHAEQYAEDHLRLWYRLFCLAGPVCFVIGTWHYVRRVEP